MAEIERCRWDGDCDHCPEDDCVASCQEAFRFYAREEAETRKRYSRESVHKAEMRQAKYERWRRYAKWI